MGTCESKVEGHRPTEQPPEGAAELPPAPGGAPFLRTMSAILHLLGRVFGRGHRLEAKLDTLLHRQDILMSQLEDLATALDAETNAIAAKIDALKSELAAAVAANQAPSADTLAKLSAISDRLKSLGSDPAQPIPAPTTEPSAAT